MEWISGFQYHFTLKDIYYVHKNVDMEMCELDINESFYALSVSLHKITETYLDMNENSISSSFLYELYDWIQLYNVIIQRRREWYHHLNEQTKIRYSKFIEHKKKCEEEIIQCKEHIQQLETDWNDFLQFKNSLDNDIFLDAQRNFLNEIEKKKHTILVCSDFLQRTTY
jgi:hypothetical protein